MKCNSEAIIAYKDCSGGLHTTCEEADKVTKEIRERQKRTAIHNIFESVLDSSLRKDYNYYHGHGISTGYAATILGEKWERIRDALNNIEA